MQTRRRSVCCRRLRLPAAALLEFHFRARTLTCSSLWVAFISCLRCLCCLPVRGRPVGFRAASSSFSTLFVSRFYRIQIPPGTCNSAFTTFFFFLQSKQFPTQKKWLLRNSSNTFNNTGEGALTKQRCSVKKEVIKISLQQADNAVNAPLTSSYTSYI